MRKVLKGLLGVFLGGVSVLAVSTPAFAYSPDNFLVFDAYGEAQTNGTITWYNRTAGVTGVVQDSMANTAGIWTIAAFEGYAGGTKIDSRVESVNDVPNDGNVRNPRSFSFSIGDSNLVGGIDRVKVTVCWDNGVTRWNCNYRSYSRD